METIGNNVEPVSTLQAIAFDITASNSSTVDIYLSKEPENNACEPLQSIRTRKSQFLIVDEEWW